MEESNEEKSALLSIEFLGIGIAVTSVTKSMKRKTYAFMMKVM